MRIDGGPNMIDLTDEVLRKANRPMQLVEIIELLRRKRTNVKKPTVKSALQKLARQRRAECVRREDGIVEWRAVCTITATDRENGVITFSGLLPPGEESNQGRRER